jgi:hypothetical protein
MRHEEKDVKDRSKARKPADPADASAVTVRKPYVPPRLVEYGSIAKLTRTQGSTLLEPHGFMRPCL